MDHDISIFDNSLGCFALIFTDEEHIEINPLLYRLYPRSYRVYLYVMIWGKGRNPGAQIHSLKKFKPAQMDWLC